MGMFFSKEREQYISREKNSDEKLIVASTE